MSIGTGTRKRKASASSSAAGNQSGLRASQTCNRGDTAGKRRRNLCDASLVLCHRHDLPEESDVGAMAFLGFQPPPRLGYRAVLRDDGRGTGWFLKGRRIADYFTVTAFVVDGWLVHHIP